MRISDWSSDVCSSDLVHAVQSAQESRFAAARWADEGRHILHADIDGDVIDRLFLAIKDVDVARSHLGLLHSRGILGFDHDNVTSAFPICCVDKWLARSSRAGRPGGRRWRPPTFPQSL